MKKEITLPKLNDLLLTPIDELINLKDSYKRLLIINICLKGYNNIEVIILSETIKRLKMVIDSRRIDIFNENNINLN